MSEQSGGSRLTSKLVMRVRFSSPAPWRDHWSGCSTVSSRMWRRVIQSRHAGHLRPDYGCAGADLPWSGSQLDVGPPAFLADHQPDSGHTPGNGRTETPTSTRDEIRQRLQDELGGGNPTGLRRSRGLTGNSHSFTRG